MEIKRGDVVLVDLGKEPQGSVQVGIRPCVVISNNFMNAGGSVMVAPISSKYEKAVKKKLKCQVLLPDQLPEPSVVLLEQTQTIDKRQIIKKFQTLDKDTMERVFNAYVFNISSDEDIPIWSTIIDNSTQK